MLNHIDYGAHRDIVLLDHLFMTGDTPVSRVAKCKKLKYDTHFTEQRYFETKDGAVCVELTVFDWPKENRTLDDLLAILHSHYGKYEGVCQQAGELLNPGR